LSVLQTSGASFFEDLVSGAVSQDRSRSALGSSCRAVSWDQTASAPAGADCPCESAAYDEQPASSRPCSTAWRTLTFTLFIRPSRRPSTRTDREFARILLRRWGSYSAECSTAKAAFRRSRICLRLQASRGAREIRGQVRFGFSGEQFALPRRSRRCVLPANVP